MNDICNWFADLGVPAGAIRWFSWLALAAMLLAAIFGMNFEQGRFNYLDL